MKTTNLAIIIILILLSDSIHSAAYFAPDDAQSYYDSGLSHYNRGSYPEAEMDFLEALNLAVREDKKEIRAFCTHYLGNIEGWKSNFPQSIIYHKIARSLFSELNNSEYVALSNNQLSFCFEALGEHDSALVYCEENIWNSEKIDAKYTVADSYQNIVRVFAKLHNYKEAYGYLQAGIEYAQGADIQISLAKLYLTAGQLFLNNSVNKDIAFEYLEEAKKLFAGLDAWNFLVLTKLSVGDWYLRTDNDSLALIIFKEVGEQLDADNHSAISLTNYRIGMVYKQRNESDSALVYLQKSIDGMCLVCPEIQIHQALIEAARLYLAKGNLNRSFEYFTRAKNIATQSKSGLEMVRSSEELSGYFLAINEQDSAFDELQYAHNLAKELGLLEQIKTTAETLGQLSYAHGMYQASADYSNIASQMKDSLDAIERSNEIAKLEMRFEIEKQAKESLLETQLLESEIAKQKLIRNTSLAGALLFIMIGLAALRAYRRKKRDNGLLTRFKLL